MGHEAELRNLREQLAEVARLLDPLALAPQGAAPMLVQVFQQVTIPTAAGRYFACHPVTPGGTESEGATPSFTVDTGSTLFVLVLGNRVPVAGDYLIARPDGGRWLADAGKHAPSCTNPPTQLYLKSTPFHTAKVSFPRDPVSGLWLCAFQSSAGGLALALKDSACSAAGAYTTFVYQLAYSGGVYTLTRQIEACSLGPGFGAPASMPENSTPGSLVGSNLFGPPAQGSPNPPARGTWTVTGTASCTSPPLTIQVSLVPPVGVGLIVDAVEITTTP